MAFVMFVSGSKRKSWAWARREPTSSIFMVVMKGEGRRLNDAMSRLMRAELSRVKREARVRYLASQAHAPRASRLEAHLVSLSTPGGQISGSFRLWSVRVLTRAPPQVGGGWGLISARGMLIAMPGPPPKPTTTELRYGSRYVPAVTL
jgi:hypothetical protein